MHLHLKRDVYPLTGPNRLKLKKRNQSSPGSSSDRSLAANGRPGEGKQLVNSFFFPSVEVLFLRVFRHVDRMSDSRSRSTPLSVVDVLPGLQWWPNSTIQLEDTSTDLMRD